MTGDRMTRSTIEPQPIKLWRVIDEQIDVTVSWDAKEVTVNDENGDRQEWEYESLRTFIPYNGPEDRAQEYVDASAAMILAIAKTRSGYSSSDDIDRETEAAINSRLSTTSPVGEQIGILRDQIARMLDGGMKPSEKFSQLQKVAVSEIAKSQTEKLSIAEK